MKKLIAVHVVIAFFNGLKREVQPGQPLPPGLEPEALDDLVRLKAVREAGEDELDETELGTQFEANDGAAADGADDSGAEAGVQAGTAGEADDQAADQAAQGAASLDAAQAQDGNTAPPTEPPASEAPAAAPKKRGATPTQA
ncbi:MAG: hypothetical protein LWW92_14025 [Rhodocyclales bacterium]|nr:hypothetical protein [Rhodocyclales bacterium]